TQQVEAGASCPVYFMFPGQGSQHARMGHGLYQTEPVFREEMDRCARILTPEMGLDFRQIMFSEGDQINQARFAQPAIFALSYSLARLWMSWGVTPRG